MVHKRSHSHPPNAHSSSTSEAQHAINSAGFAAPVGLTADCVVCAPVNHALNILLVRRTSPPFLGMWAIPGGFVGNAESPERTAQRKLTETTGLGDIYLEQLKTYGAPGRDPRGWILSIAYLALINAAVLQRPPNDTDAQWVPLSELPRLAFDHARIVADGVGRLRGKLWFSNIAQGLLPTTFTMPEARELFSAISGERYDPSNFRRAMLASKLMAPTGDVRRVGTGRPAKLYTYVDTVPSWSEPRSRPPARLHARRLPDETY